MQLVSAMEETNFTCSEDKTTRMSETTATTTTKPFKTVPKPFSIEAIISSDSARHRPSHPGFHQHLQISHHQQTTPATAAVLFGPIAAAAAMHGLNLYSPWLTAANNSNDPLYVNAAPGGYGPGGLNDAVVSAAAAAAGRFLPASGVPGGNAQYHHQNQNAVISRTHPPTVDSDSEATSDISMSPNAAQDLSNNHKNGSFFFITLLTKYN